MFVINLFGAPCSGKSTVASYIFSKLKMKGYNCELVTEVAKDLVYENNRSKLENQLLVAGRQLERLRRLENKVDIVVTDAPIMLQPVYYKIRRNFRPRNFSDMIYDYHRRYKNLNVLLPVPNYYDPVGRDNDIRYLEEIHNMILEIFMKYSMPYISIDRTSEGFDYVVDKIIKEIEL